MAVRVPSDIKKKLRFVAAQRDSCLTDAAGYILHKGLCVWESEQDNGYCRESGYGLPCRLTVPAEGGLV
jgi:hypothetical protein